ncbi:MAG: response regulator [Candidatus Hatepunaea meridiana]|nr:response regulator [Candidatus Hatepunaea meridiana]
MAKKILIIDDEEDIIKYLEALFSDEGYETVSACNGVEAVDVVKREKPDLITLDLQMPEDTGTAFYRKIHRDKELNQIPIIVISGVSGRNLAVPRTVAVFSKPPDPEELLKVIKSTI